MFEGLHVFDEKCRNIIVVSAHPMAADVGVGGIMAQAVKKGLNVHLIVMSRGETGVPGIPRNILATLREEEQRKACKELGVENIHFLGFRCNEIYDTRETRLALIKIFRRLKADVVITHTELDTHQDHRATAYASFAAAKCSSLPAIDVGEEAYTVRRVFTYGLPGYNPTFKPEIYIDITPEIEAKKRALKCYETSYKNLGWSPERWVYFWLSQDRLFGAESGVMFAEGLKSFYSSHIETRAYRL